MPYTLEKAAQAFDVESESVDYVKTHDDADGDRWVLNFGPQHPATHTTLRLLLEMDGERIARCTPHIGYLHSGFEKLGEHHDYNQYVTVCSRMNYVSPICNDIAWHGAVEKLFDIQITPRCNVLRTIMAELGRIQDHLMCVGAAALDLGAFTGFLYGFNQRERINDIMDYISGQRFHPDWTRVGGLMADLPDEKIFVQMVKRFLRENLPAALNDVETLLNSNRIFMDRTQGVGAITRDEAIQWSLSGPVARGAGVQRDVRKDFPYLCFEDNWNGHGASAVEFKVPIMNDGDVYSRYFVRLFELKQSAHIIEQLIDNIPSGPVDAFSDEVKLTKPSKEQVYGSIEGLIQQFELVMTNRGWKAPVAECYGCQETSNGELGFYIVGDGGPRSWRAHTRAPSFINYQSFPKMIEGHMLADIVAVLGSLNIIAAELDR